MWISNYDRIWPWCAWTGASPKNLLLPSETMLDWHSRKPRPITVMQHSDVWKNVSYDLHASGK